MCVPAGNQRRKSKGGNQRGQGRVFDETAGVCQKSEPGPFDLIDRRGLAFRGGDLRRVAVLRRVEGLVADGGELAVGVGHLPTIAGQVTDRRQRDAVGGLLARHSSQRVVDGVDAGGRAV